MQISEWSSEINIRSKRSNAAFQTLEKGTIIADRYTVINLLGRGSSGSVYACTDQLLSGLSVAVKLFPRSDNDDLKLSRRIYREMLTCNNINHPNVTKFYDCIYSDEFIGYSMEYVDGNSISSYIESKHFTDIGLTFKLFKQIILGLHAIHLTGVVHRDIKPSNILCTSNGFIKISDFGVATQRTKNLQKIDGRPSFHSHSEERSPDSFTCTEQGRFVGTPRYLSPEYIEHGFADFQADIYAAGIILYELITKNYPFQHDSLTELLQSKVEDIPASPCEFREDCPSNLNRFILNLIATNPKDRFESAAATLEALNLLETDLKRNGIIIESIPFDIDGMPKVMSSAYDQSKIRIPAEEMPTERLSIVTFCLIMMVCCTGSFLSLYIANSYFSLIVKSEFENLVMLSLQYIWYFAV